MNYLDNLEKLAIIGITMAVKTIHDETLIGEVFYYDPNNKILILKEKIMESTKYNYRYINTDALKEYNIMPTKIMSVDFDLPELDYEEILNREAKSLEENTKHNGDLIYDKLSKNNLKPEWQNTDIVIKSLKARIRRPYKLENIEGSSNDSLKNLKRIVSEAMKNFN